MLHIYYAIKYQNNISPLIPINKISINEIQGMTFDITVLNIEQYFSLSIIILEKAL